MVYLLVSEGERERDDNHGLERERERERYIPYATNLAMFLKSRLNASLADQQKFFP